MSRIETDAGACAVETGAGAYQLRVESAGHSFLADEPVEMGGLGSGPAPYDLLCAALAACTTITLRMVAQRKGLAATIIRTEVSHARVKGDDGGQAGAPVDLFTRAIFIDGPLDEDARNTLLAMAELCPVHKTLSAGAQIRTGLAPA